MAHANRYRLLIGAAVAAGLLIAVLAAAPLCVDANACKPEIVAQVKRHVTS